MWFSFGVVDFCYILICRRGGEFGGTLWRGSPSGPRVIPDIHIGFNLIMVGEFWRDSGEIFSDFRTVEETRVRRRS